MTLKNHRYRVPQFKGQESIANLCVRIDAILEFRGAVRVLADKRRGCTTFALPDENQADRTARFNAIYDDLQTIHPECRAWGYKSGEL